MKPLTKTGKPEGKAGFGGRKEFTPLETLSLCGHVYLVITSSRHKKGPCLFPVSVPRNRDSRSC